MEKIGILTCLNSNDVCTRAGCLKAFYERKDFFRDYPKDTRLAVCMTCNGCPSFRSVEPEEDVGLLEKIDRLTEEGVTKIHVGVCRMQGEKECERMSRICDMIETRGIKVIRGTHRE